MAENRVEADLPLWKTVAVVAVVVASLGFTYPKIIHPMVLFLFGFHDSSPQLTPERGQPPSPPHGFRRQPGGSADSQRRRSSPSPPPPMFPSPVAAPAPSGKGLWSSLLPVYTVGVIVFLLYSVSKIIWRQPDRNLHCPEFHYNAESDSFEMGPSPPYRREGGRMLHGMNREELHNLHNRLTETETSLKRILKYLEQINDLSDGAATENLKFMTKSTLDDLENMCKEEAYRAAGQGQSSPENGADGGVPYIHDLEAALAGFKQFTDDYMMAGRHVDDSSAAPGSGMTQNEAFSGGGCHVPTDAASCEEAGTPRDSAGRRVCVEGSQQDDGSASQSPVAETPNDCSCHVPSSTASEEPKSVLRARKKNCQPVG